MKPSLHRAGVVIATAAVTATLALAPTAAHAATSPQAAAATGWLADELPDDGIVKVDFGGTEYPDYGLTLDFALAFQGDGTQSAALDDIVGALEASPGTFSEYTTNVGFGDRADSQIAGATAKLATVVQLVDRDAASFGGHDLVDEVESVVVDDGAEAGRASDISDFGDNSNALGQSFAVRALAGAGSSELGAAADYLTKQQCDTGVFRINMSSAGCGAVDAGDTTSVDTTAFAVEALMAARAAGYDGADGAVDDAVAYLVGVQDADGSFDDEGKPNSNSTGLAAVALGAGGESAAASKAADFVAGLQVATGDNAGAIAFDQAAFDAVTNGQLGDQWRRTTAQAALGVAFASAGETDPDPEPEVGPVATMELDVSVENPKQGDTIAVTATGEDADGQSAGDVSDDITLESSVASDTIEGNTVTFNTASPHRITATHTPTGTTASILVEVTPTAAAVGGGGSSGSGLVGGGTDGLPDTGASLQAWQLLLGAGMVVLGGVLVAARRRSAG